MNTSHAYQTLDARGQLLSLGGALLVPLVLLASMGGQADGRHAEVLAAQARLQQQAQLMCAAPPRS
ncbi:MAG: hypothetical protein KBC73_03225 [Burkholderiaceae bacterium]|nr:hypothetical protein [Burkholderiaceae bacterium]